MSPIKSIQLFLCCSIPFRFMKSLSIRRTWHGTRWPCSPLLASYLTFPQSLFIRSLYSPAFFVLYFRKWPPGEQSATDCNVAVTCAMIRV